MSGSPGPCDLGRRHSRVAGVPAKGPVPSATESFPWGQLVHTQRCREQDSGHVPRQRTWCELRALRQVQLTVSPLPALSEEDELLCLFGDSPAHPARVEGDAVICNSPRTIPNTPPGQGEAPRGCCVGPCGPRGAGRAETAPARADQEGGPQAALIRAPRALGAGATSCCSHGVAGFGLRCPAAQPCPARLWSGGWLAGDGRAGRCSAPDAEEP